MTIRSNGNTGIGTSSPQRRLHVEGEARISDLTTDTPTRIVGADADGDLGEISLGTGLSIASGTLNTSAILPADTSVFARDFQISGTGGYVPKFTTSSTIANSALYNPANSKVMIGHTSGNSLTNNLEIHSATSTDAIAQPSLDIYLGANGFADYTPRFNLYRNRSTTVGGLSRVNNGDWLGRLVFHGADSSQYVFGAQVYAIVDGATSAGVVPTALRFATNPGNSITAPTDRMSITSAGHVGIGTTSPARTLHVEGEARISDLTTDTPTRIVGADADGDLGEITLGTGLSISSVTLNASGIASVYIPINLFSPGDTVANTTNAKDFFLVHSGLNGYCIDSYTVKALAGTGSADIQLDKNGTGGNTQSISGTTVYTKDTNIALVTGDYIRGQVFNLSGTLVGLGLTIEIKATCN